MWSTTCRLTQIINRRDSLSTKCSSIAKSRYSHHRSCQATHRIWILAITLIKWWYDQCLKRLCRTSIKEYRRTQLSSKWLQLGHFKDSNLSKVLRTAAPPSHTISFSNSQTLMQQMRKPNITKGGIRATPIKAVIINRTYTMAAK